MFEKKKVAVVGAGITGILTAHFLNKNGFTVHVFEEERYAASRCSFANGGQLSVSNSEVWTTWSNVKRGLKWLFRKDAPLYINPKPEWQKMKWLMQFLWHTACGHYAENTQKTIALGLQSRTLYRDIVASDKIKFDYSACGILHIYNDSKYADLAKASAELFRHACPWEPLDDLQDIEPVLAHHDFKSLYWTPGDATGDIQKFCIELKRSLQKRGVVFFMDEKVNDLSVLADQYDAVVVCAGVGSRKLASSINDKLPIYPVKGYSITINNCDPKLLPKVSIIDDEAKIVTATLGNRFRIAGTAEFAGENYDISRNRIEPLLNWVRTHFPDLDCSDYTQWACLRPMTPNMMPIVRQSKRNSKVFYNTGHGHLGWTLGPATARDIANQVWDQHG